MKLTLKISVFEIGERYISEKYPCHSLRVVDLNNRLCFVAEDCQPYWVDDPDYGHENLGCLFTDGEIVEITPFYEYTRI